MVNSVRMVIIRSPMCYIIIYNYRVTKSRFYDSPSQKSCYCAFRFKGKHNVYHIIIINNHLIRWRNCLMCYMHFSAFHYTCSGIYIYTCCGM